MEPKENCFQRILVGYDGSPQSTACVHTALAMAGILGSKVSVILWKKNYGSQEARFLGDAVTPDHAQLERKLESIVERANPKHFWIETEFWVGHSEGEVLEKARSEDVDLIVIGHDIVSLIQSPPCSLMIAASGAQDRQH